MEIPDIEIVDHDVLNEDDEMKYVFTPYMTATIDLKESTLHPHWKCANKKFVKKSLLKCAKD